MAGSLDRNRPMSTIWTLELFAIFVSVKNMLFKSTNNIIFLDPRFKKFIAKALNVYWFMIKSNDSIKILLEIWHNHLHIQRQRCPKMDLGKFHHERWNMPKHSLVPKKAVKPYKPSSCVSFTDQQPLAKRTRHQYIFIDLW